MKDQSLALRIRCFADRLRREDVNMHAFQPHRMYSVSKTMTGIAVGMLADDGKISLDQPIADFFADWLPEKPDGRLLRLTIRDMLRMATCYRQTAYREGVDENWAKPFFTGAPTHEPGMVFHYDTGCSQVLAALVKRARRSSIFWRSGFSGRWACRISATGCGTPPAAARAARACACRCAICMP